MSRSDDSLRPVMPQRVHPHQRVGCEHARVPGDDCAGVVAAHAAGGAVGHDLQANAARHDVEGAGGAVEVESVVVGALMAARQKLADGGSINPSVSNVERCVACFAE